MLVYPTRKMSEVKETNSQFKKRLSNKLVDSFELYEVIKEVSTFPNIS